MSVCTIALRNALANAVPARWLTGFFSAVWLLTSLPVPASAQETAPSVQPQPTLTGTNWLTLSWRENGTISSPLESTLLTIQFGAGVIRGFAGCNRYQAILLEDHAGFTIAGLTTTRQVCQAPIQQQELKFLEILKGAFDYTFTSANELQVTYATPQGTGVLTLMNPYTASPVQMLYVDSETVQCRGLRNQPCLMVRTSERSPWQLFYDTIDGFEFEPGFTYVLRVQEQLVENPPADGPSRRWVLQEIISKTPVTVTSPQRSPAP